MSRTMGSQRILVTGGAGYIGSTTCVSLLEAGHEIVVVDNLSNSSKAALDRVLELVPNGDLTFYELDIRDRDKLANVFRDHEVHAVIHFAGMKAVGESVEIPLTYYDANVAGTVTLLQVMHEFGVHNLVFSSSATVYGDPQVLPITEDMALSASNPYGRTKLIIEDILRDVAAADLTWHIALLRYFNPVGAHSSGRIGEDPSGIPNNLMPFIMQVAVGRRSELVVFGDDYATRDGTCIRDYIHVVDLAEGHVAALGALASIDGCVAINLGTGTGSTVIEVHSAAEVAVGSSIALRRGPRRAGDAAACYADATRAADLLGWRATRSLGEMCASAWHWQSQNPNGYGAS